MNKATRIARPVSERFAIVSSSKARGQPRENEDCLFIDRSRGIVGVFDGVGGRGNGRDASYLAARIIREGWKRHAGSALPGVQGCFSPRLENLLQELVKNVDRTIHEQSRKKLAQKPPATTVVLALLTSTSEGAFLTYAHLGDSRLYLLRKQQHVQRLTEDDGYFAFALKKGVLTPEDILRIEQATTALSEEDLSHFKRRNQITCALGWEDGILAHTGTLELFGGDRLVLCTDGIHDNLTDQEIADILGRDPFASCARRLVRSAYQRSQQEHLRAKKDDMSAVAIFVL